MKLKLAKLVLLTAAFSFSAATFAETATPTPTPNAVPTPDPKPMPAQAPVALPSPPVIAAKAYLLMDYNSGQILIGENTKEMLECDLKIEHKAHADLKAAIAYCESIGDYASRELLEEILCSEEEHIDWIESQLGLIEDMGLENYLSQQIHKD